MAETQTQQRSERTYTEEEIAAAITIILSGAAVAPVGAVAFLLGKLPGAPEFALTSAAARLIVGDREDAGGRVEAPQSVLTDNLIYRAHYAIAAVKRMGRGEGTVEERLADEEPYLHQHRDAERRRIASAKMIDAAAELHGPLLGWKHGHPKEPRPHHLAADGHNFTVGRVPTSTGALPGALPGCTCTVVAPYEGAPELI